MIALLLSEQVMAPLRGSELAEPLMRLRSKLEAMMGPQARAYVEQLRGGLLATVPAAGDYGGRRDEIARIELGIREHRQLRLVHFSAHRGDTLERIVVEFAPALAHLPSERRYHRTQKLHPLPDGGCRVTFDAAGLPELASWVASFGGQVLAVAPSELVAMVRDLHRRGLEAHEDPTTETTSGDASLDDERQ
jgi:predicted DNA-binding transcriptional regulator YafY